MLAVDCFFHISSWKDPKDLIFLEKNDRSATTIEYNLSQILDTISQQHEQVLNNKVGKNRCFGWVRYAQMSPGYINVCPESSRICSFHPRICFFCRSFFFLWHVANPLSSVCARLHHLAYSRSHVLGHFARCISIGQGLYFVLSSCHRHVFPWGSLACVFIHIHGNTHHLSIPWLISCSWSFPQKHPLAC